MQKVAQVPPAALNGGRLGFRFIPLAFDSLGTPSEKSAGLIENLVKEFPDALRRQWHQYRKCEMQNSPDIKLRYLVWSVSEPWSTEALPERPRLY